MSSTQLIPSADYEVVSSYSDPIKRWLSTSQDYIEKEKPLSTTTRLACGCLLATASTLSCASAGGLGIAYCCCAHKAGGIVYAFWSTLVAGGCLGFMSGSVNEGVSDSQRRINLAENYRTIEGVVKLRFELLSNPPVFSYNSFVVGQVGILPPEVFARLEKLRVKLNKLNNEDPPFKNMPEEAVRENPVLSARLDAFNEKRTKWETKWNQFRPILERELPNPQSELELNAPREELELFE